MSSKGAFPYEYLMTTTVDTLLDLYNRVNKHFKQQEREMNKRARQGK